jgi:hypothetical protein
VLWAARRYRESAEQIEILYGDRWKEFEPLNDTERADILRAGMGFALSEDKIGIARFREKYAAKMAEGPDAKAFNTVTGPIGTDVAEFQQLAKRVAAVDTLDGFLREMRVRYPEMSAYTPTGQKRADAAATKRAAQSVKGAAPVNADVAADSEPTGSILPPTMTWLRR